MKSFKTGSGYILRLDKGEEVVDSVLKFVEQSKIKTSSVIGLGAVTNCVLGYFDRDKKTYLNKNFNDVYELISLNGNITYFDGNPVFHVHVAIGDQHCNVYGGHFFSGTVAVTAEIFISETDKVINRSYVDEFGLNLIDEAENV